MTCSTLIYGILHNEHLAYMNRVAIRSHQATCDSKLTFYDHDIQNPEFSDNFRMECEALGVEYKIIPGQFNASAYMNTFLKSVTTDLVVWATSDVLFYHNWLGALIFAWKKFPSLISLHPYTFSNYHRGTSYSPNGRQESDVVITTRGPVCHVMCIKRSDPYVWDESFPFWEADSDFHCYLTSNQRDAGIVRDCRIDHFEGSIARNATRGQLDDAGEARKRLVEKWGLTS